MLQERLAKRHDVDGGVMEGRSRMTASQWPLMRDSDRKSLLAMALTPHTRVLIVEDDSALRLTLVQALRDDHYLASPAGDGEQALQLLELERYDVVVLAEHLHGMCGDALARRIRAWPARCDVGLIALTADSRFEIALRLLEAGCDAFLAKPISTVELREVVREVALSRFRARALTAGAR